MSKNKTKFVNALDLELEDIVQFGGSDYRVINLGLNAEEGVVVVVIVPLSLNSNLGFRCGVMAELRLIVPKHTPFTVLK